MALCMRMLILVLALAALGGARTVCAQAATEGREAYNLLCSTCHGASGDGNGPFAVGQNPPATNFTRLPPGRLDADRDGLAATPMDFLLVTRDGAEPFGGSPIMPPIANLGGDAALAPAIVEFIFSEFVPRSP